MGQVFEVGTEHVADDRADLNGVVAFIGIFDHDVRRRAQDVQMLPPAASGRVDPAGACSWRVDPAGGGDRVTADQPVVAAAPTRWLLALPPVSTLSRGLPMP